MFHIMIEVTDNLVNLYNVCLSVAVFDIWSTPEHSTSCIDESVDKNAYIL